VVTTDEVENYGDSPFLVIYPAVREGRGCMARKPECPLNRTISFPLRDPHSFAVPSSQVKASRVLSELNATLTTSGVWPLTLGKTPNFRRQ
jgi:hypothetical protein